MLVHLADRRGNEQGVRYGQLGVSEHTVAIDRVHGLRGSMPKSMYRCSQLRENGNAGGDLEDRLNVSRQVRCSSANLPSDL